MAELNPNTKVSKQNETVEKKLKLDRGKGGKDVISKVKESTEGILKKGFKCDICGHFAKRYWDVSRHCGESHADTCGFHNFICQKCDYKTPRRKHMINHIESNCLLSKTKPMKRSKKNNKEITLVPVDFKRRQEETTMEDYQDVEQSGSNIPSENERDVIEEEEDNEWSNDSPQVHLEQGTTPNTSRNTHEDPADESQVNAEGLINESQANSEEWLDESHTDSEELLDESQTNSEELLDENQGYTEEPFDEYPADAENMTQEAPATIREFPREAVITARSLAGMVLISEATYRDMSSQLISQKEEITRLENLNQENTELHDKLRRLELLVKAQSDERVKSEEKLKKLERECDEGADIIQLMKLEFQGHVEDTKEMMDRMATNTQIEIEKKVNEIKHKNVERTVKRRATEPAVLQEKSSGGSASRPKRVRRGARKN